VVVNYLKRSDAAEETVKKIVLRGGSAWKKQADVTDATQARALVEAVLNRHGRLDILVNNVGVFLERDVFELTDEEWHRVLESNLSSVFYCTRVALPAMRKQASGRIVNIGMSGSQHTHAPARMAAYAAAKAGMIAFSKSVALEEAKHGITVNVVCPGIIPNTERPLSEALTIRDLNVPIGRPGTWEDVANAVLFLVAEESSFITGSVLEVNGGWQ
jgi:3-oxoacyl-[acyl-carrier protein] reductase